MNLIKNDDIDIIVWAARNHSNAKRNPNMFGWIDAGKDNLINEISVKKNKSGASSNRFIFSYFLYLKISLCSLKSLITAREMY